MRNLIVISVLYLAACSVVIVKTEECYSCFETDNKAMLEDGNMIKPRGIAKHQLTFLLGESLNQFPFKPALKIRSLNLPVPAGLEFLNTLEVCKQKPNLESMQVTPTDFNKEECYILSSRLHMLFVVNITVRIKSHKDQCTNLRKLAKNINFSSAFKDLKENNSKYSQLFTDEQLKQIYWDPICQPCNTARCNLRFIEHPKPSGNLFPATPKPSLTSLTTKPTTTSSPTPPESLSTSSPTSGVQTLNSTTDHKTTPSLASTKVIFKDILLLGVTIIYLLFRFTSF